ncbi:hypothetical protein [Candidatus Parabeggiatoa sp. HSG14]|uniref:hypothetical protein n=1 Tax=Candidatus Parabeggiatoa sp. HSG14 TaxID=3055593 RepID=UPI0025A7EA4B|nr:hypothetical protein [Thiotrichales bacterium HSG14]
MDNLNLKTVQGFGDEWSKFNQSSLTEQELQQLCSRYFKIFPWESLPDKPIGFDLGCGSVHWRKVVSADKVNILHCIDTSEYRVSRLRQVQVPSLIKGFRGGCTLSNRETL